MVEERYDLVIDRIKEIKRESLVEKKYQDYFINISELILQLDRGYKLISERGLSNVDIDTLKEINTTFYEDIMPENYERSYANPEYANTILGDDYGKQLSFLYAEIRSAIPYVYESRLYELTIILELNTEIYSVFTRGDVSTEAINSIIYWYASDYCDVFVRERVIEQINPGKDFAIQVLKAWDADDLRYLYMFGEYISESELRTAHYINKLPQNEIDRMAEVFTEGFRMGFENNGKDLSIKSSVNIRYTLGFDRVVIKAIDNFAKMGLSPIIYRSSMSVLTKRGQSKIGFYGGNPNMQYDYDHRNDQGLFLDKKFVERKLEVLKATYEENAELAGQMAGPAVIEIFGEKPFIPTKKQSEISLRREQEKLVPVYDGKSASITNEYIKGEERSFTIIAFPVPEIGESFEEIFDETIKINTLDAKLYENIQKGIIDILDTGDYVHILGKDNNTTDLRVALSVLNNPEKETLFENCVADVNIPVGEVFTSPKLEGTNGVLNVSQVYLNGLAFKDLKIELQDGMVCSYNCSNFDNDIDNKKHIKENILFNHDKLPIGEFAIGTNTTAYVMGRKYAIEDKLPILIAEKTGPHFALGDTCYSRSEDVRVYNPDGKEIIAKDNSCSILRKEDAANAYFNCHTDITIPYDEIGEISIIKKDGSKTEIIKDGFFVLEVADALNEPLKKAIK
ncbi:MAG: aminopeptidase [Suipraeoptans sp.]